MEQARFRELLTLASQSAIDFAQTMVTQSLSHYCLYDVHLNQSHDGYATPEMTLYPEDENIVHRRLTADEVVELLCRDSRCPQWMDISAAGYHTAYTRMQLLCCGRFVPETARLYYAFQGTGPFGIKSPNLPRDYKEGDRFTLADAID